MKNFGLADVIKISDFQIVTFTNLPLMWIISTHFRIQKSRPKGRNFEHRDTTTWNFAWDQYRMWYLVSWRPTVKIRFSKKTLLRPADRANRKLDRVLTVSLPIVTMLYGMKLTRASNSKTGLSGIRTPASIGLNLPTDFPVVVLNDGRLGKNDWEITYTEPWKGG